MKLRLKKLVGPGACFGYCLSLSTPALAGIGVNNGLLLGGIWLVALVAASLVAINSSDDDDASSP